MIAATDEVRSATSLADALAWSSDGFVLAPGKNDVEHHPPRLPRHGLGPDTIARAFAGAEAQSIANFVIDRVRSLFCCFGGNDQRVSNGLFFAEPLSIIHALDMDREHVSVDERHRTIPLHDLVLKASPSNRIVFRIGPAAADKPHIGCVEVDLGTAVPIELADRGSHECQRDGEAVPFGFRTERGR